MGRLATIAILEEQIVAIKAEVNDRLGWRRIADDGLAGRGYPADPTILQPKIDRIVAIEHTIASLRDPKKILACRLCATTKMHTPVLTSRLCGLVYVVPDADRGHLWTCARCGTVRSDTYRP